ncbi:MAG TPA: 2TM domain-containing protein [Fimbriimonadaceae bacterium]|nr:2TM domain-containing protein [Fimbriimonadaceae bacterium]
MLHRYEEEDVQEILSRALRVQSSAEDGDRQALIAAAAELGVSEEALAQAEKEWFQQKAELSERREFDALRKRDFLGHVTIYAIVNTALFLINLITPDPKWWFLYPLVGWGIGLAFHAVATFNRKSEDYEQQFQEWREKRSQR